MPGSLLLLSILDSGSLNLSCLVVTKARSFVLGFTIMDPCCQGLVRLDLRHTLWHKLTAPPQEGRPRGQ